MAFFLNMTEGMSLIGNKVLGADVLSSADAEMYVENKTLDYELPELIFNDSKAAYDRGTNTVYIPQNMSSKNFEGKLKAKESSLKIFFKKMNILGKRRLLLRKGMLFLYI